MAFRAQDLHDLDVAREVRIETHRADGRTRSTIIWVVVDNGTVFVRSVRGAGGLWYQEALDHAEVTLDDQGRRLEGRAIPVHDPDSIRRTTEALTRKYANDQGYAEMITPDVLDATFRIDPLHADELPLEAPLYLGADEPSELGPAVEIGMLNSGATVEENVLLQPQKPV